MQCPECLKVNESKVIDSRTATPNKLVVVRRRRECLYCGFRFTTYEINGENLRYIKSIINKLIYIHRPMTEFIKDAKALRSNLNKLLPRQKDEQESIYSQQEQS